MTFFKHTRFEDSNTMRSLVKVAQEKGWIKEEPIKKTASAPVLDLTPSQNLTNNILKLCSGLRASGFEKQAEELESKFVQLKQANTLYDVSKEEGDDLVHAAHPEGSHHMEDVEGEEATFEDILDKHLKFLEVANKKPLGKDASSQDILKAVKSVLTHTKIVTAALSLDDLYDQAAANLQKFTQIYETIKSKIGISPDNLAYPSGNNSYLNTLATIINKREVYGSEGVEDKLVDMINYLENDMEPGWFSGSDEKVTWKNEIVPLINVAKRFANSFQNLVSRIRTQEENAKTQATLQQYDPDTQTTPQSGGESQPLQVKEINVEASPVVGKLSALIAKLKAYANITAISNQPIAIDWIRKEIAEMTALSTEYSNVPTEQQSSVGDYYMSRVNKFNAEVSQFASSWLAA